MSAPTTTTTTALPAPSLSAIERLVDLACEIDWLQASLGWAPGERERLSEAVQLIHLVALQTCEDQGHAQVYGVVEADTDGLGEWVPNDWVPAPAAAQDEPR